MFASRSPSGAVAFAIFPTSLDIRCRESVRMITCGIGVRAGLVEGVQGYTSMDLEGFLHRAVDVKQVNVMFVDGDASELLIRVVT